MSTRTLKSETDQKKDREIGLRIRQAREQKGYKQDELGPMIGLSSGAAAQWETGRVRPSIKNLEKLAPVLGTSVSWLMNGDHPDEQARAHTNTEFETLQIMRKIPADHHDIAMKMLKSLIPEKADD